MQAAAAARRARGATRTAGAPRQGSAGPGCARRDVPRSTSFRSTVSITHERNAQALRVRFGGSCAEGAGQRGVRAGVCRGRLPGGGLRTRMAMVLVQDGNASPWKGLLQAGAQSFTATMGTGDGLCVRLRRYPLARALFTGSSRARQKVAPCCLWRRRWGRRPCAQPARSTAAMHAAFATHSSAEAQAQRTGATQGEHASCARAHG